MPSKSEVIEDILAAVEEEFYKTLKSESYPHFFGGKVQIAFTTAPRLVIEIHEIGKPGPKLGAKFKKRVGPRPSTLRAMQEDQEEF